MPIYHIFPKQILCNSSFKLIVQLPKFKFSTCQSYRLLTSSSCPIYIISKQCFTARCDKIPLLPSLPISHFAVLLAALVGNRNTFSQKSSLDYVNTDTSQFYQKINSFKYQLYAVLGLLCTVGSNFVYDNSFLRIFFYLSCNNLTK